MNVKNHYSMLGCLIGLILVSPTQAQTGTVNYSLFSNLTSVSSNVDTADGTLVGIGSFDVTFTTNSGTHFSNSPGIFDFPPAAFINGTGWTNPSTTTDASVGVANDDNDTLNITLDFDFTTSPLPAGYDFFVAGQRDSTVDLVFSDAAGNPIDVSGVSWGPILGNYSATFSGDDIPIWNGGVTSGTLTAGASSASGNGTIAAFNSLK